MAIGNDYTIKTCSPDFHRIVALKNGATHLSGDSKDYYTDIDRSAKGNTEKLSQGLIRARSQLYDLVLCNDFDCFGTFTLDPNKYDRENLNKFRNDFSQFVRDYRKKHGLNIQYVLVPELHKDGKSWHMHGFINGLSKKHLIPFEQGIHPQKLIENNYLNWLPYSERFGFCSFGPIRDKEAASKYILKYITKEQINQAISVGSHLYFPSRGLKRPERTFVYGRSDLLDKVCNYANEWCKTGDIYINHSDLIRIVKNDSCDLVYDKIKDFLPVYDDMKNPFIEVDEYV